MDLCWGASSATRPLRWSLEIFLFLRLNSPLLNEKLLLPVTFLPLLLSMLLRLQDFFLLVFLFPLTCSALKLPHGYFASVCCAL